MTFTVSGLNMLPFIEADGLKLEISDIDGPNAGRLKNGDMQRDRIATKYKWTLNCRPLTSAELSTILTAIRPEYVSVRYTDPVTNTDKSSTYYSNNIPISLSTVYKNGVMLWKGLSFPLIQK